MPVETVRLRSRPEQRRLGGYGGGHPSNEITVPEGWEPGVNSPASSSFDDGTNRRFAQEMLFCLWEVMFHPMGDPLLPQERNPLDLLEKQSYKLFGPDVDQERYTSRDGRVWHTCCRFG
jgi:hypothetical protein